MTTQNLIYSKSVDKSMLTEGFGLPLGMLSDFQEWFGKLEIGKSRSIVILFNGNRFPVVVQNQPFSRIKYPTLKEIYQIRYLSNGAFSAIRTDSKRGLF